MTGTCTHGLKCIVSKHTWVWLPLQYLRWKGLMVKVQLLSQLKSDFLNLTTIKKILQATNNSCLIVNVWPLLNNIYCGEIFKSIQFVYCSGIICLSHVWKNIFLGLYVCDCAFYFFTSRSNTSYEPVTRLCWFTGMHVAIVCHHLHILVHRHILTQTITQTDLVKQVYLFTCTHQE